MKLFDLKEQRSVKVAEMQGLVAAAESAGRDLSDQERGRFDALKGEVRALDTRIGNAETVADMERRADADAISGQGEVRQLEARYSLAKALVEHTDSGRLTGVEAEWAAEHRSGRQGAFAVPVTAILGVDRRALLTTTPADGPGGNLIATTLGPLADRIRPALAIEGLGATVLTGLVGNFELPRLKSSGTSYWVAEHQNVTRSDPSFEKMSMGPKTCGAEYEISRRMLLQAQPALETVLRNDLSYLLREALDRAAVLGGGANEPAGLLAASTGVAVQSFGTNGGAITLDLTADMIGAIPDGVAGARGFLTNAKVKTAAMKLKDGDGAPFGVPKVFHDEPVRFSDSVPSNLTKGTGTDLSALIYGAWQDLILGYWSAVDILPNPYHVDVASKGGLLLHAFLDADVAVRHPESFVVAKDVKTAA